MADPTHIVQLRDGAQLPVWLLGDASKTLLIALHGAPGFSSHAEPLSSFGFLADKFRVLVYDARGSGNSKSNGPYTNATWIADLDELREWAGADTFILAGGSYGGFLALEYTVAYPDRVGALILRDTVAFGNRMTLQVLASVLTSTRVTVDVDRQIRLWSGTLVDQADFAAAVQEILPIYTPPDIEARVGEVRVEDVHFETQNAAFSYNVPRYDVRQKLGQIDVPTLVVVGRHDVLCTVAEAEEIHRGIKGSQLVVFEKSGHSPPRDEPEAFRDVLRAFLDTF